MQRGLPVVACVLSIAAGLGVLGCGEHGKNCAQAVGGPDTDWPQYGNDPGGTRYSSLADIGADNVQCLEQVWKYRTGDLPGSREQHPSHLASEVTPVLVRDRLILCTPYNRVIALAPASGEEIWSFDPHLPLGPRFSGANQLVCRGVATWSGTSAGGGQCVYRVFTATNDARLIALDTDTGALCNDFGEAGTVDLTMGVGTLEWRGEYQVTSPPVVVRDLVLVGSAVADNVRTDAPSGVVRAYDARSGELRWAWDLRPPGFVPTPENTSQAGFALATPNVWAPMSVDPERGLVFVPTGNPAPDFFRGDTQLDFYGSSVVALHADTGEVVWRFQTVHHDLWDYDVPAQPTLFTLRRDGREIPALVQATKMGMLFILHRETGEPLFPVEERPVPQAGVPGERLAETQPFPLLPAPLVRHNLSPSQAWGLTPWDGRACRKQLESLRFEGIYTPPTLEGTLVVPGNAGGSNWGGVAVDEGRQLLVANTQDLPWSVQLIPRNEIEELDYTSTPGEDAEVSPMRGTPYQLRRQLVTSPLGIPCSPPPWGELAGVDLSTGEISWQVPLGSLRDLAPIPLPIEIGTPNLGGPLATGSGLVFIGAAFDRYLRAFDGSTGRELWRGRLPFAPQATPMTYRIDDRQFVVIAAMGYGRAGVPVGDALIAFALPRAD